MATAVIMPRQGQSVESCIIGEWHKQKGDKVAVDDLLFTYETDKATFDEKSKVEGTILEVYFEEGDDVPVLTNVLVIGEPGEATSEYNPHGQEADKPADQGADGREEHNQSEPQDEPKTSDAAKKPVVSAGNLPEAISPRAKNLAERSGVDLRFAEGSGPKGRVIERDIRQLIADGKMATSASGQYPAEISGSGLGGRVTAADAAAGVNAEKAAPADMPLTADAESYTEKHSRIRKLIAASMQQSLASMAQLTLNSSFDATDILQLRQRLKKAGAQGLGAEQGFLLTEQVPTINDLILYAVARVIERHPACNAWYDDEKMTYFKSVNLGVAVDTPRGLMVPTVFNAQQMTLGELSKSVKAVAAACQQGTISPDQLKNGTFTITNLGTLDVESFTPVINPPQTCILGVCSMVSRVRENDGEIETYPALGLSLTFDHRAIDGAPAARFLQDLKRTLENFSLLLMQG